MGIMPTTPEISLSGISGRALRRCGSDLQEILQYKFGCKAEIHGVDFENSSSFSGPRPTVQPEQRFAVALSPAVKVSVWRADLTQFHVDAVVNAANERLQNYGGLAQALSDAGGPDIQASCDAYITRFQKLDTGKAVLLTPGTLPCQGIIHAVGPCLLPRTSQENLKAAQLQLQSAVECILDLVEANNLKSVAIPAVSSGLFNFPLDLCAKTIVTTIKDYYKNIQPSGRRDIRLTNHDLPTVTAMETACHQILGHPQQTQSQASARQRGGGSSSPSHQVYINGVNLILRKGKIEEQKTDVIVNTAAENRNLNMGEISKALLNRAGREMQAELHSLSYPGHLAITQGYKLNCKEVFHTFCPPSAEKGASKVLSKVVSDCLRAAVSKNHRSIAFPAIGTGHLGFSKLEAAHLMTEAILNFAQTFSITLEVHIVIFPRDKDTFEAFEMRMRRIQKPSSPVLASRGLEHHQEPCISLKSDTDEAVHEARRWLRHLLDQMHNTVVITNNFIQYFGEREHRHLFHQVAKTVSIQEFLERGKAGLTVRGSSKEDTIVTVVQVEAMLCQVQREFVKNEEHTLSRQIHGQVTHERKETDSYGPLAGLPIAALKVVRVDKLTNPALRKVFDMRKRMLTSSDPPKKMYQRVPAQFCNTVAHIGFHAEFSPPDDPEFGSGIYFAGSLSTALKIWAPTDKEEYLYFVEADVLTGVSTPGSREFIAPPKMFPDGPLLYDSLSGHPDVSVIFSGCQALPKYLIICKRGR